jgi:DNA-binding transcriptional MerR regulator
MTTPNFAKFPTEALLSIGEVITRLREEFPDISISKIRFLEANSLVTPDRTPSGYRKFSLLDVERLRYVLRMQRDHFLPLRVIRENLEAIDRGLEPPTPEDTRPTPPRVLESTETLARVAASTSVRLTESELIEHGGANHQLVAQLQEFGLVTSDAAGYFDATALGIVRSSVSLGTFGLEPRHLKTVLSSANREIDLFSPLITAARSGKNGASVAQAEELTLQLANSILQLHELVVRSLIEQQF